VTCGRVPQPWQSPAVRAELPLQAHVPRVPSIRRGGVVELKVQLDLLATLRFQRKSLRARRNFMG
jgi:hypothetical protein